MSFKKELSKEIKSLEEEIKQLEIKRSRSQASIIDSLITKQDPDEQDVQFFRTYSAEIELKREQLAKLNRKLETL
ncbi:MAG: hypothetical protein K2F90_05950 [Clostridiales bacterium]|nr:hypothetical protein [Clostridiales bacterium]